MWLIVIFLLLVPVSGWLDWHGSALIHETNPCFYKHQWLVEGLFYAGPIFVNLLAAAAIALVIMSFSSRKWRKWRTACLLFLLSYSIGLAVVHGIKVLWPRPRPVQVSDFGGFAPFRALWQPLWDSSMTHYRSFPSAHAFTGFSLFAWYFVGKLIHLPWLQTLGLVSAWTLGIALSLSRMLAGGHFLFDTICAGLIGWFMPQLLLKMLPRFFNHQSR
jgi:membrane-associated PAP2 superfamily phosphatase